MEPGELPKQAVIREVQEELGVDGILKAEAEVITIDPRFKLHFFEVTITQPPKAAVPPRTAVGLAQRVA